MIQFENIEQIREYVDSMKDKVDNLGLPEKDWKTICELLIMFEKILDDRECLFQFMSIVKDSFSRMNSIVGTDWDAQLLASMNKTLQ